MKRQLTEDLLWLCPYHIDNLIRIGRDYDGGYIVPQLMVDIADSVLSLGLGDDWSFEQQWNQLKPADLIHIYDGDPVGGDWTAELAEKFKSFIQTPLTYFPRHVTAVNFNQSLNLLGLNVFLKMDIEGGEYDILKNIVNNHMRIIGITMEIHDVSGQREKFVQAMKYLQTEYTIVHMHGNTYAGDTLNGVPMLLTDVMEFTMVRKEFCTSTELRKQVFIEGLDQGNCPNFEDIEYYY